MSRSEHLRVTHGNAEVFQTYQLLESPPAVWVLAGSFGFFRVGRGQEVDGRVVGGDFEGTYSIAQMRSAAKIAFQGWAIMVRVVPLRWTNGCTPMEERAVKIEAVVKRIESHLASRPQHVARVSIGPRREGWFNAEAFVALSSRNVLAPGGFSVYGEEDFSQVLKKLRWQTGPGGKPRWIPDLLGYGPKNGEPPKFLIESKVVYSKDRRSGEDAIRHLASQLDNAGLVLPGVPLIGIVYCVQAPRPGNPDLFLKRVSDLMEIHLKGADGFVWVNGQRVHPVPGLNQLQVAVAGFNCYSTVALGARVR